MMVIVVVCGDNYQSHLLFVALIHPVASGQTIARPRDESKEDKKARKAAVKAEKQVRRAEKKSTKEQFGAEVKDQKKRISNRELRLKKL